MPYPGNVHKYIMPVLLMSSCYKTSNKKLLVFKNAARSCRAAQGAQHLLLCAAAIRLTFGMILIS